MTALIGHGSRGIPDVIRLNPVAKITKRLSRD